MLNNRVRILNFDNSITRQNNLIARFSPVIVDLRKIAPYARLWLDKKTEQEIIDTLDPRMKGFVTFIGSGDFHHITSLLISRFDAPINIISFDHHPDWDTLPPKIGCGSWITRVLTRPDVKKVILLGIASDDISDFNIQTANLAALKNGRLEIYPYGHSSTRVLLRKVPLSPSIGVRKGLFSSRIYWQELKNKDLAGFAREIAASLEVKQTYISIDKDCLRAEYSLTNWEAGRLRLDDLLTMLKALKENTDIVGLDITGDYSQIDIHGRIKSFCSRCDHPKDFSAKDKPASLVDSINEEANLRILNSLDVGRK